jgi:plasmid stabilization system protein ParE
VKNKQINWDKIALKAFETAIKYIGKDSIQSAEKVRKDIITKINLLQKYPYRYSPYKYKKNNDGRFRAFEIHRFRISYFADEDSIRIVRFRHTAREPKKY